MVVTFKEISGNNLKRELNAQLVRQTWHNRNKRGGNFGIMIRTQGEGDDYELRGLHNVSNEVVSLELGKLYGGARIIDKIITPDNYREMFAEDVYIRLRELIGVSAQPAQVSKRNRDEGAKVTEVEGIKFADYTVGGNFSQDVTNEAISFITRNADRLKKLGIKRVELDTIGGYHFRGISQGRFVSLTTMHSLRLLKK